MQHIRQVLPTAEAAIAKNSYSPDYGQGARPQPEPQKSAYSKPQQVARHKGLADWFWWLVEEMVRLRSCHVSENHSREEHILRQLEARKFTSAEATAAEQHILYGNWRSEKTLRIGLEISDFYPDAISVTRQEFESMRQRMYRALLSQVHEELQRSSSASERNDEERSVIEEYRQAIVSMHMDMQKTQASIAVDRAKDLAREVFGLQRRVDRLQARLAVSDDERSELGWSITELQRQNTELKQENAEFRSFGFTENSPEIGEFWDNFEDELDDAL